MIVAVWGNNGAGKSTAAIKIALEYAAQKRNVILIDTDFVAPQAKIWFPKENIEPENSMGTILANNIELDNVSGKITMVNEHLGILGYARDLSINSVPSRNDTPTELLTTLLNIAEVIVVDCQSNITQDIMTFMALDIADAKVICMTPDLRGLSWYEANVNMVKEKWNNQNTIVIPIFSKVKDNSPVDAMEKAVGNIEYYLPYYKDLEEELYTGTIGTDKYKGASKKYGQIIKSLCAAADERYNYNQQLLKAMAYAPNTEQENIFSYENATEEPTVDDIKDIFNGIGNNDNTNDDTNIPQEDYFSEDNEFEPIPETDSADSFFDTSFMPQSNEDF